MNTQYNLSEIRQIAITVDDVAIALPFYRDVLGLTFFFSPSPTLAFLGAGMLTYTLARESVATSRLIDDVRWVEHRMHRGHTRGYLVKFTDGSGIFVCRSLSNSHELAIALENVVKHRSTSLA